MRIVSLLPSATELIAAIGGTDHLVGRSHECDFPPGLGHLPVLTAARTAYDPNIQDASRAIDTAVRDALAEHTSLYTLDAAALAELRPDLILTQDLCDVCSIDLGTVRGIVRHMNTGLGLFPEILALNPTTLEGVLDDLHRVGRAAHMEDEARDVVVSLRDRLFRAEEHVNAYAQKPVVGFVEWTDPVFIAGHWNVEIIERAGGDHPLNESVIRPGEGAGEGPQRGGREAGKSIAVEDPVFAATKPDAIIIAPCGLTLDQAEREARALRDRARVAGWWDDLPAVQNGKIAIVDGNQMFNRPGPRLIDAFEWTVGFLQDRPELMPAGFPWRALAG
ncbi:MAG: cobalamin-binding protein [Planctomycetota bacterium]